VTIVAGTDDSGLTDSQVVFYVGNKTGSGTPVERAGLTNGTLYALRIAGAATEPAAGFPAGTAFTLASLGNVENRSGAQLDMDCLAAGCTTFNRPEDGAWDPSHPSDFYFVTTASFTGTSRLWRARFADLTNLAAGGTLDMLLDGTEGQKMFDNLTITAGGKIYLQEDVGNQDHIGKVWRYDIAAGRPSLTAILQHNPAYFTPGAPQFITRDEESSGVIDASAILGAGWFLLDVQAHRAAMDPELYEGGQYLAFFDPAAR
jgi:secreted PhoX family phosphatase